MSTSALPQLPVINTAEPATLPPEVQAVLDAADPKDMRYSIAVALREKLAGNRNNFCHLTEQFRTRFGSFPFNPAELPCGTCDDYL